jgi:uncharacterized damage-inducible protein DinB
MKDSIFLDICKNEYHALIEMLHEAINLCSEDLWNKETEDLPFWQLAYHSAYYLDFYLGEGPKKHVERFDIKENLNERMEKTLTKKQLKTYLKEVKAKCDGVLEKLSSKELEGKNSYFWTGPTLAHRMIYNIRHSQHHVGQLNLILRIHGINAAKWVITPKKRQIS